MSGPRERYRLEFVALPSEVPAIHRLRALLKGALRVLRLKCVSAVEVKPDAAAPDDPDNGGANP